MANLPNIGPYEYSASRRDLSPEVDILDIRRIGITLWHRKHIVILSVLAGLLLAFALSLTSTPTYQATALVVIDPGRETIVDSPSVLPTRRLNSVTIASAVELIRSDAQISRALTKLKRQDLETNGQPLTAAQAVAARPSQAEVRAFKNRLRIRRLGDSQVIAITMLDGYPERAARIVNLMAQAFTAREVEGKREAIEGALLWLSNQIVQERRQTTSLGERVQAHRSKHGLWNDNQVGDIKSRLAQLDLQLSSMKTRLDDSRQRAGQLQKLVASPSINSVTTAQLIPLVPGTLKQRASQLLDRISTRRSNGAEAATFTSGGRPSSASTEAGLTELLRDALRISQREILTTMTTFRDRQNAMVKLNTELKRRIEARRVLVELSDQEEASRALLKMYLKRKTEVIAQVGFVAPNSKIASLAKPPEIADKRSDLVRLGLCLALGLGLGIGSAMIAEQFSPALRTRKDVREKFGLPVIADFRRMREFSKRPFTPRRMAPFRSLFYDLGLRGRAKASQKSTSVVSVLSLDVHPVRSLVTLRLAQAMKQEGLRVLVIDADSQATGLTAKLLPMARWDLAPVMIVDGEPDYRSAIIDDIADSGIAFLPAVRRDGEDQPSNIEAANTHALLGAVDNAYDVVLIDIGPKRSGPSSFDVLEASDFGLIVTPLRTLKTETADEFLVRTHSWRNKLAGIITAKMG